MMDCGIKKVFAECEICEGTGVIPLANREGKACPCPGCKGTGMSVIKYLPYQGRKLLNGIDAVIISDSQEISYNNFLAGGK